MENDQKSEMLVGSPFSEIERICQEFDETLKHTGTSSTISLLAGEILKENIKGREMYLSLLGENKQLREKYEAAVRLADMDDLTGLPMKKTFEHDFYKARSNLAEHGILFSVALLDIDRFRSIGNSYNGDTCSLVLKEIGDRFKQYNPVSDGVYRCDKEKDEIFLLCSGISGFGAVKHVEEIAKKVSEGGIDIRKGAPLNFSFSGGVYSVGAKDEFDYAIGRVSDALLDDAKKYGGNRIVLYEKKL